MRMIPLWERARAAGHFESAEHNGDDVSCLSQGAHDVISLCDEHKFENNTERRKTTSESLVK